MNLLKHFAVFGAALLILTACSEPIDPEYIEPTSASEFASEPYKFTKVNFDKLDQRFRVTIVKSPHKFPKGTLVVDPNSRYIYLIEDENYKARRYPIAVGREGFQWAGSAVVGRKAHWPSWRPTPDMLKEDPNLPEVVKGGDKNPLGARALYLYDQNGRDTLFRIHGTNSPRSIGTASSSGCIRMFNEQVIDLYNRVPKGTPVVVLRILKDGEYFDYEPTNPQEYFDWLQNRMNHEGQTPVSAEGLDAKIIEDAKET
jgi:lipoprotein-anchoring transpeptidase ErfK/SrfK